MNDWYVYMLKCSDNSIYTGITTDLNKRVKRHNSGDGAKYTRSRRPVSLAYFQKLTSESEAKIREMQIKSLGRDNKERLIGAVGFPRLNIR